MNEKRKKVRLSVDIPAKIRFNGITTPAMVRNLSCGGIYIQTPDLLPTDKPCELTLNLPDGRGPMILQSEVVWQAPPVDQLEDGKPEKIPAPPAEAKEAEEKDGEKAGLRFNQLDTDQKARINEFIRRNIREDLH